MIRDGEDKDLDRIVKMAREFWKHTVYDEEYCPDTVWTMAAMSLDQNLLSVLEIDGVVRGFACGVKGALLGNSSVSTGTELAWWVDTDYRNGKNGIALMKYLENLAKKAGIKYWNMIFMESSMPDVIEGIYQKMGYSKTEVSYTKVL